MARERLEPAVGVALGDLAAGAWPALSSPACSASTAAASARVSARWWAKAGGFAAHVLIDVAVRQPSAF